MAWKLANEHAWPAGAVWPTGLNPGLEREAYESFPAYPGQRCNRMHRWAAGLLSVKRNPLSLIFAFVFLDLLGYSLFLPLLPYYAGTLGASPVLVGLLIASNALAQLVASPTIGRLSDRYGRRPLLIASIAGTLLSFLLLGLVEPLGGLLDRSSGGALGLGTAALVMLFASRILDGLTGGNIALARAYITDVTDEESRARGLGMIGAAFGLGFIVGPAMGGLLSNWAPVTSMAVGAGLSRYAVPAFVAVLLAGLNLAGVLLWLPESLTPERRAEMGKRRSRALLSLPELWGALRRPRFGPLLHVAFVHSLAFALFTANFALYTQVRLDLSDRATSYILTYVGLLVVLVQGLAIGRLTQRFSETRLVLGAALLMAPSLLAWAAVPNVPLLLVVLAPLALGGGVLNTVISSLITKSVYPNEVGGALGLSASLEALTRVVAPALGGLLIQQLGASSLGVLAGVLMAWLVTFIWRRLVVNPDPPLPRGSDETAGEQAVHAHSLVRGNRESNRDGHRAAQEV
jgi:MFS transporter, DHA1 family, tetracycline resistance protein